jgi:hypothetical protein
MSDSKAIPEISLVAIAINSSSLKGTRLDGQLSHTGSLPPIASRALILHHAARRDKTFLNRLACRINVIAGSPGGRMTCALCDEFQTARRIAEASVFPEFRRTMGCGSPESVFCRTIALRPIWKSNQTRNGRQSGCSDLSINLRVL